MYEVTMNNDNFEKHFVYVFNEGKYCLIIKNKKFEYKNNIKEFGYDNVKLDMYVDFINDDNNYETTSLHYFSRQKYIIFQFETEEDAFYFKMKYC